MEACCACCWWLHRLDFWYFWVGGWTFEVQVVILSHRLSICFQRFFLLNFRSKFSSNFIIILPFVYVFRACAKKRTAVRTANVTSTSGCANHWGHIVSLMRYLRCHLVRWTTPCTASNGWLIITGNGFMRTVLETSYGAHRRILNFGTMKKDLVR